MRIHRPAVRRLLVTAALALMTLGVSGCYSRHFFLAIGTAIDVLPGGFVSITVGTVPYYYHRGVFYRPYRRGYVVVPAPIGAILMAPPAGHTVVLVDGDAYSYYRGVFYASSGGRYAVVRPPIGAFVTTLPDHAATRRVDGVEYKEYAGTYYRPAIQDGRRGFQVTDPPER